MGLLDYVRDWQPFKIDALGIVTLLGGNSLERALGRLVLNPWTEYLPLIAAQVVLDDTIAEPLPGFVLYNITDRIKTTVLSAWFTRWLLSQNLTWSSTTLTIDVLSQPRKSPMSRHIGAAISFLLSAFLISFTALLYDWYGLACALAIILLTGVRASIVSIYRSALDQSALQAREMEHSVKLILSIPTGRTVTIYTTRGILLDCLLAGRDPQNAKLSFLYRSVGWLAFGVFIITLGMASLTMQMLLIACTIVPSVLVIQQFQCDESHVGSLLQIDRSDIPGKDVMAKTYAALDLSPSGEDAMISWEFFPLLTNTDWWEKYNIGKIKYQTDKNAFEDWADTLRRQSTKK